MCIAEFNSSLKIVLALCVSGILFQESYESSINTFRWKRQTCKLLETSCDSGECVEGFKCDGNVDCKDKSDETLEKCQNFPCPPMGFKCDYGGCIDGVKKCDGENNCPDGSDERNCSTAKSGRCRSNQFLCNSSICIDQFLLCDGTEDCDDGSDETYEACNNISSCPGGGFQCNYGGCIDADGQCNGIEQCADGSDEKLDKCQKMKKVTTTTTTAKPEHPTGCILPPQPKNGQYSMRGCKPPSCSPIPGDIVHNTLINYTCNSGFALSGSEFLDCDGSWSASFPTCSQVSCTPLVNPTRDIECTLNDTKVECDKPMAPGTTATVTCNLQYTSDIELTDFVTQCQSTGKWSQEITSCIPRCGEPNPAGLPFLANSKSAKYGEFPWHTGIYKILEGNSIEYHCGGNIISENVIITAAHCFWDEVLSQQLDTKLFKIAVGKYYIDWNNKLDEYVQTPEIAEVLLHGMFRGRDRRYENDIAAVILKEKIRMTDAARPICVDLAKKFHNLFSPGKRGIVVGWGITEYKNYSSTQRTATLPYVDFTDCENKVPESFLAYLTSDKFCAGYGNGTSVCPGDSGGGYAVKFRDGKWYLMGIVSVGVPGNSSVECNLHQYTTFTKVYEYYDFIKKTLIPM